MAEDHVLNILNESTRQKKSSERKSGGDSKPRGEAGASSAKSVAGGVDALWVSHGGDVFLTGWVDDRAAALSQVRLVGRRCSKTLDKRELGRWLIGPQRTSSGEKRLAGVWAVASLGPEAVEEEMWRVEFGLVTGAGLVIEAAAHSCAAQELNERLSEFLAPLAPGECQPPENSARLDRLLKIAKAEAPPFPRHTVEAIVVAEEGGVFIVGWIDDTQDPLGEIRLNGAGWQVTFAGDALGRVAREDVQASLKSIKRHAFGFWGFASVRGLHRGSEKCRVELSTKAGARQRLEASFGIVDEIELRNLILGYLGNCRYLGNPNLDAVASVAKSIGRNVVDLNSRITRDIVAQPYIERFGRPRATAKGSIVVCLYGKPEYLFLQNALFADGAGIEDYEFIYVCNSPELAERLLRDARICARTFDVDLTLVLLPGNAGFGAANNVAVKHTRSDRILIVNPDVFPYNSDWAAKHSRLIETLPGVQTRLFGAPLYYDDGSLMHAGLYFDADIGVSLAGSAFKAETYLRVEHFAKGAPPMSARFLRSRPVPGVTGAFISCDRDWFEKLDGFSEDYVFGHYEDADFCLRSLEGGVAPWIHDIKLWHLEGKGSIRPPTLEGAMTVNRWLFNKQWSAKVAPSLIGQRPSHPLLQAEVGDAPHHRAAPPAKPDGPPQSPRDLPTPGLSSNLYTEVVFGGEDAP